MANCVGCVCTKYQEVRECNMPVGYNILCSKYNDEVVAVFRSAKMGMEFRDRLADDCYEPRQNPGAWWQI